MVSVDKFLVTGFSGFVSKHFIDYLEQNKISAEVLGIDIQTPAYNFQEYKYVKVDFKLVDLLNKSEVEAVV